MNKDANNPFIIFSAFQGNNPEVDLINHKRVASALEAANIKYKSVLGSYKGNTEESFLVGAQHREHVIKLATEYNQESILEVNPYKVASLTHLDGTLNPESEVIGEFSRILESQKDDFDGWTLDRQNGQYWTVK